MSIKKFKENEIPYEKLEKVGLTRQMIEDLPEDALSSILAGQRSPAEYLLWHRYRNQHLYQLLSLSLSL